MENNIEVIKATDVEVVDNTSNNEMTIDKKSAKQLTNDIKSTTTALYVLLKRAHDTKAWQALGYNSWTEYIEEEFDFSRARSYQLINQANVIEEINAASGVPLYITESEARSIKKRLPEITERLEEIKEEDLEEEEAKQRAREIIEQEKEELDNSANYQDDDDLEDDRKGFSKGGTDDGWDDPEHIESEVVTTNFSNQVRFAAARALETLEVYDLFPNAKDIGRYLGETEDVAEVHSSVDKAMRWLQELKKNLEGDEE